MKRILFLLTTAEMGGAEKVIINIANKLDKENFDVTLFLFFKKGELLKTIDSSVNVDCAYGAEYQSMVLSLPGILMRLYKYRNYDFFIAGTEIWPTYVAGISSVLWGVKTIAWVHTNLKLFMNKYSFLKKTLFRCLNRITYKIIDKVVAVSSACDMPGYVDGKTEIIPNSYNKRILLNHAKSMINDFKFDDINIPVILSVSRLDPIKNISLLIKAHALLIREGVKEIVLIIGSGSDFYSLKKLTTSLEVDDSVIFLGGKDNPYPYFLRSTIFVNPSLVEGFSLTGIESMVLGTPVISTSLPNACSLLIKDNQNGIIVSNGSVKALARAMKNLIENPQKRILLSRNAKKMVEKYEESKILEKINRLFNN